MTSGDTCTRRRGAVTQAAAPPGESQGDEQPAGRYPELRALCLKLLNDPTWESEATALVDAPDPDIALAMRQLLGRPATRH